MGAGDTDSRRRRAQSPRERRACSEAGGAGSPSELLDPRGPIDLHPDHALVDADLLTRYHSSPFDGSKRHIRTWTVDDADEARRLIALGVDALITNAPQRLARTL